MRELPDTNGYEVAVVDSFSGDIVVSRNFDNKEAALRIAENMVNIRQMMNCRRSTRNSELIEETEPCVEQLDLPGGNLRYRT